MSDHSELLCVSRMSAGNNQPAPKVVVPLPPLGTVDGTRREGYIGIAPHVVSLPFGTRTVTPMFAHQIDGVAYIVGRTWSALCDDCGLGKTIQAIYAARELVAAGIVDKLVVVCKPDLVTNWQAELKLHAPEWSMRSLYGRKPNDRRWSRAARIHVLNYDLLGRKPESNTRFRFRDPFNNGPVYAVNLDAVRMHNYLKMYRCILVLDESQKIKSPTTRVTRTLCTLGAAATRRVVLTATLQAETPADVWSQMHFLDRGKTLGDLTTFTARHVVSKAIRVGYGRHTRYVPKIIGFRHVDELHAKVDRVSLRRLKPECIDLPPKITKARSPAAVGAQLKEIKKLQEDLIVTLTSSGDRYVSLSPSSTFGALFHMLSRMVAMPQVIAPGLPIGAKFASLMEVLTEVAGQVLVATMHRDVASAIHDGLNKNGITSALALGGQKAVTEKSIADFKSGDARVLVGVDLVLREGHNFQHSSHCVLFEHSFSLLTRNQLTDRQHRIGQTEVVTVEQLIMPTSLDAYALSVVDAKEAATKSGGAGTVMLRKQTLLTALQSW